jgi:phosphoglycerate kinase
MLPSWIDTQALRLIITMTVLTLKQSSLKNKVVFLRADLNVPMQGDQVTDMTRLKSISETLIKLIQGGAKVILASHYGRPKGQIDPNFSMKKILPALQSLYPDFSFVFKQGIPPDQWGEVAKGLSQGTVLLAENLRFYPGEEANSQNFAQQLAKNVDLYVNDAFSCSHRAHASIVALTNLVPAYMGESFYKEIESLEKFLLSPKKPLTALIGGAKISTKFGLLEHLLEKVDQLVVVGAMANTLYYAMGKGIGHSLFEENMVAQATNFLKKAKHHRCCLYIPADVLVAKQVAPNTETRMVKIFDSDIQPDDIIVDAGPEAVKTIQNIIKKSKTVVWNGALGIAEIDGFDKGTVEVAKYLAELTTRGEIISIAGGGDTLALIKKAQVEAQSFSYLSTAGGAFLEWLEGKKLPGLKALEIK